MTHDELQDAITHQIIMAPPFALGGYVRFLHGLQAIVELHKPDGSFCSVCGEELFPDDYPCSTIQAIEKELA